MGGKLLDNAARTVEQKLVCTLKDQDVSLMYVLEFPIGKHKPNSLVYSADGWKGATKESIDGVCVNVNFGYKV